MRILTTTEIEEVGGGDDALNAAMAFVGIATAVMITSPVLAAFAAGASVAASGIAIYNMW